MQIDMQRNEKTLTVCLSGRLDAMAAPELMNAFKDTLAGIDRLAFDLGGLEYISSAGLRVLLSLQKTMNRAGGMVIRNARESVIAVFELTGMLAIFHLE